MAMSGINGQRKKKLPASNWCRAGQPAKACQPKQEYYLVSQGMPGCCNVENYIGNPCNDQDYPLPLFGKSIFLQGSSGNVPDYVFWLFKQAGIVRPYFHRILNTDFHSFDFWLNVHSKCCNDSKKGLDKTHIGHEQNAVRVVYLEDECARIPGE
ncbi:MAG TPA: hypothetical protein PKE03_12555, partial [Bacteroidales bacterium]|nr:hypothetical protein [Bacteroidales bacterium]